MLLHIYKFLQPQLTPSKNPLRLTNQTKSSKLSAHQQRLKPPSDAVLNTLSKPPMCLKQHNSQVQITFLAAQHACTGAHCSGHNLVTQPPERQKRAPQAPDMCDGASCFTNQVKTAPQAPYNIGTTCGAAPKADLCDAAFSSRQPGAG